MALSRAYVAWIFALVPVASAMACVDGSDGQVSIGDDCVDGFCREDGGAPGFVAPDAGSDARTPELLRCVGTECPAGYATCGEGHRCATNLESDSENCGACGNKCPYFDWLSMSSQCVAGTCESVCDDPERRDCNGVVDDGCEANFKSDPKNCGGCGIQCAAGVRCVAGACGCASGLTDCDGRCVDLKTTDGDCGSCGHVCETPTDAAIPPPNSTYGCNESECGSLKCIRPFKDCNGDLANPAGDGCETNTSSDPHHCGKCGVACGPEQVCAIVGVAVMCACPPNQVLCAQESGTNECTTLLDDAVHCGACGHSCPSAAHTRPLCKYGLCDSECEQGWGDCDGDRSNGCETNLLSHPGNCGACGTRCRADEGQPCIEGVCLMVACDGGVTTK